MSVGLNTVEDTNNLSTYLHKINNQGLVFLDILM